MCNDQQTIVTAAERRALDDFREGTVCFHREQGELFTQAYEKEIAALCQNVANSLRVGDNGTFRWFVSYYPDFIVEKGFHGEITSIDSDSITIKVSELMPGAELWNNEVNVVSEEVDEFAKALNIANMTVREYIALWFSLI
jgi:hypothetical protein